MNAPRAVFALALLVALVPIGGARADGESAIEAGSGRQQSLLEHRRQQLDSLRERVSALDESASAAIARAAELERELGESRSRLEAVTAREAALEAERDEQRDRADAAVDRIGGLESELAEQRSRLDAATRAETEGERALDAARARLDALEAARARTLATLERYGLDDASLDDELDALVALRASEASREERGVQLESQLESALADAARLDAEREALLAERDEARRENATSAARVVELESALADAARLDAEREELLAERDEVRRENATSAARVVELESALAGARARLERLALEEVPGDTSSGDAKVDVAVATRVDAAGAVGGVPGDGAPAEPSADDLVLSERWYVSFENGAPRDYLGHDELSEAGELPPADACETFADGAAADEAALAKLEVNGFPVTAFWVRREDGRPGICRLVPRTSGAFDARLSSLAVLRSERAIVVTRRGGR